MLHTAALLHLYSLLIRLFERRGEERLRITPTPGHTTTQIAGLVDALNDCWNTLGLKRTSDWAAIGGRAGVGAANHVAPPRIWTDAQLGLLDGTAPKTIDDSAIMQGQKVPYKAPFQHEDNASPAIGVAA
jgi:5-aminolevulinate synthase